jgi:two-component system, OmpR family, alkaline phosphatase synthesis response regulator PhoP
MPVKHILIIDDEPTIQEIVQTTLEVLANWQVSIAGSGLEGLQKAKTIQPDAILLDVSMPDLDGFYIFAQLQAHPATQAIPVILLTARVQLSQRSHSIPTGILGLILKPFDPVRLPQQISELLGWIID